MDITMLKPGDKVKIRPRTRNNNGSRPKLATVLNITPKERVLVEADFIVGNRYTLCLATVDPEDLL
jgi:hypothetical protein